MSTTQFKVGDRVRITRCIQDKNKHLEGMYGTVSSVHPTFCWIDLPGYPLKEPHSINGHWNFNYSQLELISPQSPQPQQPQQTQQKEDTMKQFVVIYMNLAQQGSAGNIQSHHATEAEAKEAAEALAAQQRSNIQIKQYFAITVVNTKTGKLVGSIIDAPPAVDWS